MCTQKMTRGLPSLHHNIMYCTATHSPAATHLPLTEILKLKGFFLVSQNWPSSQNERHIFELLFPNLIVCALYTNFALHRKYRQRFQGFVILLLMYSQETYQGA